MRFLYERYIWEGPKKSTPPQKPNKKIYRAVNFEDIQDQRRVIGKKAEEFALQWEKERLIGNNLEHIIADIDDRTKQPSYGYDFLSYTAPGRPRYIEVKSVSKQLQNHRFFLSENERSVSLSKEHQDGYYFYLVSFDSEGNPIDLEPRLASELFKNADLVPASYTVHFILEQTKKNI
jgi:hypothetical protein